MSRIDSRFAALARAGRRGLIAYIAAGDPAADLTVPLMQALAQAGADVIELGVPFSDPMADGPVIQRASERAIRNGVGLRQTLQMVAQFRAGDGDTPVVLMGYANPIEAMGRDAFVTAAARAGVDGVLVVDNPPEECESFAAQLRAAGLDPIFLLAPTTTDERIERIARVASGYLYYVSLKGITGAGHLDVADVAARMPVIKSRSRLPIGVGFGIKDAASAQAIARIADAVVIGSRIIQELENAPRQNAVEAVTRLLSDFRRAIDEIASPEESGRAAQASQSEAA